MKKIILLLSIVTGLFTAFLGVSKVDAAAEAVSEMKQKIAYGTPGKPVEVYFVSDWFCPSCKKVEPIIEALYPQIKSKVTFYFIDYPIHKKSSNFTPYNLAFLINDRSNYFKARNALMELTKVTEDPTDEDIEKIAKKEGLVFHELSYLSVKAGIDYFDKVVNEYHLNATPVVIITNPSKKSVIKLEGRDEISEEKILEAINNSYQK